ncbi:MAG TPA: hypothetical protein DCS07_08380 [Bdellovibrionales bacterium]|nr:MAG: hypothetical protein A2Z97_08000 [Bdellovibrionales bacterium GWB1_52_6]OFZ03792.1 MAG: hypothetical protein A2X97_15440 [Bdellovibrionales bacterium GWA1_52_35]OFZ38436.1 MAG: hypothetical protein A2070_10870 [Bdellovibrionales bacterium GWC1_52_8]HAR42630.1 hypothetical protein [Bdellovibrionales bacterium]HCM40202.1 hypothetical protein [Bdellovibrionales bacterium]
MPAAAPAAAGTPATALGSVRMALITVVVTVLAVIATATLAATGLFKNPGAFHLVDDRQSLIQGIKWLVAEVLPGFVLKDESDELTRLFRVFGHAAHDIVIDQEPLIVIFCC